MTDDPWTERLSEYLDGELEDGLARLERDFGAAMSPASDEPTPETTQQVTRSERVDFPCENCGADMRWDPTADALSCEHCGHVVQVPRGEGTIVERALDRIPGQTHVVGRGAVAGGNAGRRPENVDSLHPGIGFLSENPQFARLCRNHQINFSP